MNIASPGMSSNTIDSRLEVSAETDNSSSGFEMVIVKATRFRGAGTFLSAPGWLCNRVISVTK